MEDTLFIQQARLKSGTSKNTFSIEQNLTNMGQQKSEELFSEYNSLSMSPRCGVDRYEIISQYYALGRYCSIQGPIFIYDKLTEKLEKENPSEVVVTNDVEAKYQEVVRDAVSDEITLKFENKDKNINLKELIWTLITLCYRLLVQLVCAIFYHPKSKRVDIAFIFTRKSSVGPVIQATSQNNTSHIVVTLQSKIKNIIHGDEIANSAIMKFITVKIWLREVIFYIYLLYEVYFTKKFAKELNREFQLRSDRDMLNTIDYATNEIFASNTAERFTYAFLSEAMLQTIDCEKIVTSTLSPSGRAILQTAEKKGVTPYHIPHSVITPAWTSIGKTNHFVCGDLDMKYLNSLPQVRDMSKYIATGRPYFYELYNEWQSTENEIDGYLITIATQPMNNKHEFVRGIINAAEQSDTDIKIEIKIHPSEEVKEYKKYEDEEGEKITVVDDKLFERISRTDLVLTKNSNVGLEAMIVGTPCVAVNWWEKSPTYFSYTLFGPVPVCERKTDIHDLFDNLDESYLEALETKQKSFVRNNIQLCKDPSKQIVEHLNS